MPRNWSLIPLRNTKAQDHSINHSSLSAQSGNQLPRHSILTMARTKQTPKILTPKRRRHGQTHLSSQATEKSRKKYRHHPGTVAIRQIRWYQKSVQLQFPKSSFKRLVYETVNSFNYHMPFNEKALLALQEAAEAHLVEYFEKANLCAIHAKRVTICLQDLQIVGDICKRRWLRIQYHHSYPRDCFRWFRHWRRCRNM